MILLAFEFVVFVGAIVATLLAFSGLIYVVKVAWEIFENALKGK